MGIRLDAGAQVPLQGLPLPVALWETDVLPRRVPGYQAAWLDQLCASGEVVWVGAGLDSDLNRLESLISQEFKSSNFGVYMQDLKAHFEGPVVADMVCLLRLQLELSVQARVHLMARQAGLNLPVDDDLTATVREMDFLRNSIGTTGLLALKPLQVSTRGSEFHRHVLQQARRKG